MRVGLMVPGFNPYDAVGNDVLGMMVALAGRDVETFIFTPDGESGAAFPVMHYRDAELLLDSSDDIIIYHYCVADPLGIAALRRLRCRILIKYHNITPAILMSRWSADFGRVCRLGRTMLTDIADLAVDCFLADSAYNGAEILGLGIEKERVKVLAPLHRCDELLGQPDEPSTERTLEKATFNVLSVGRLVPNKGFDVMAESFAKVMSWGCLDIHLHHVGYHDPRLQAFTDKVGEILVHGGVRHRFTFHGQASPRVLATLYRHCDMFWTTSFHEGFCVPAVEAMAFGLPILSSRHSALPETCANAAIYANTADEFAVSLHRILSDDLARSKLGYTARQRYNSDFRPGHLKQRFLAEFDSALEYSERRVAATSLDRSGDWFGLPRHDELLDIVLPLAPEMPNYGLAGRDRRIDLVGQALLNTADASNLKDYFCSPDVLAYAREIEMPQAGRHLSPHMRLLWTFNRFARSRFDLQGPESVTDFCNWFARDLAPRYKSLIQAMEVA